MPRRKKAPPEEVIEQVEVTDEVQEDEPKESDEKEVDVENPDEEAVKNALEEPDEKSEPDLPKLSPTEKVQRGRRLLAYAKNARRKYDKEWLSRDLFRRGYQFISSGKNNSVSISNSRIPVNLTWAFARSIKNQITSFNPKWDVLPEFKGKKAESMARLAGKTLDSIFKINNMNKLIKDSVTQGLFFSNGGPFEAYWDEDYDNGKNQPKGEVRIRLHDPFDIFFDPNGIDTEDCGFIIKAVRTDLDRIQSDPLYKDKVKGLELGGTLKRAESEYKQFLLQTIQDSQQQTDDNKATILYEMHEKIYSEGEVKVSILTWLDEVDEPLRDEVIDQEYYDMEVFQADSNPLEMYGESWSKHVIAINRASNALESSIFDYHYRFAKGRLVIDKNSGVNQITNEHGSIIEKNRGATVTDLPISPLPNSYETQLNRLYGKGEDIAGVHEASLGRVPNSVKSGIGIAELKQSDACVDTNVEALTKNGWKKYDELISGEEIYVLDPETKKGKWGVVNKVFFYDKVDADVYDFNTRNFECLATVDHSWLIYNARENWSKVETQDLKVDHYIPIATESSDRPIEKTFSDDFVELVAWVLTEGTYSITKTLKDRGSFDIRIYQSTVNGLEVKKINDLFERMGITRKPYLDNRGCWQFTFANKNARLIREMFPNKSLTINFVNQLTMDQLKLLVDTMILADGSEDIKSGKRCFINTKKDMIDAMQLACTYLGIATNVSGYDDMNESHEIKYVLYLKKGKHISVGNLKKIGQFETIKFTGRVWCPNTDAGFWLARKNGKVFYTGNTNQDDLVQNLEQCLMNLGKKVLKKVAKHYDVPRIKRVVGTGRLVEHFAVVGEDYAPEGKDKWALGEEKYPLAKIAYNNELTVNIGSWLAYTREGRQTVLMDLASAGIIDKETVLKYFEFPDVQDIVDKTRTQALVEAKRKEEPGMPSGISQEQLIHAENEMLMEGSPVPVDPETDDHELHIALHNQVMNEENAPVFLGHIEEHRRAQKGGGQTMATSQPAGQLTPPPVPQLPPPIPSPTGQGVMQPPMDSINPLQPTPVPPLSFFSAGTPELPPTASSILGGPTNQLPTQ